jgi:hypothetical protein
VKVNHITFSGRWSAFMQCRNEQDGREWLEFNVREAKPLLLVVPPIEEQVAIESRSLWQRVSHFLGAKNTPRATDCKFALEEKQRVVVAALKETGAKWEPQCFTWDQGQTRYVPNGLNLSPAQDGEEPAKMPPPFRIPEPILAVERSGAVQTFQQLHEASIDRVDSQTEQPAPPEQQPTGESDRVPEPEPEKPQPVSSD